MVGCQKFVQYIRMLCPGRFILVESEIFLPLLLLLLFLMIVQFFNLTFWEIWVPQNSRKKRLYIYFVWGKSLRICKKPKKTKNKSENGNEVPKILCCSHLIICNLVVNRKITVLSHKSISFYMPFPLFIDLQFRITNR